MAKIALDGGHGLHTPGKRSPSDEREWSFNNIVVRATQERLEDYHSAEVLRLDDPTGRTDTPLAARTNQANRWGADILVSIHHNAFRGVWGTHTGVETYTYTGNQPESTKLANAVQPRVAKAMGLNNRGVLKKNLHMLRESNMPAILTEGGYMDSTIDIKVMRSATKLRDQGVAIADGIAEYLGLKLKTVSKPSKEEIRLYKPSINTLNTELVNLLQSATDEGILNSDSWVTKAKEGKLSLDDAVGLQATIINRRAEKK